jgi:hypothetical protein
MVPATPLPGPSAAAHRVGTAQLVGVDTSGTLIASGAVSRMWAWNFADNNLVVDVECPRASCVAVQ